MTQPRTRRGFTRATGATGAMTEAAWQQNVVRLAGYYGWRTYHTRDSRGSDPGFPDLVLIRGPELLFAELKPDRPSRTRAARALIDERPEWLRRRDLTDSQAAWLGAIRELEDAVAYARGVCIGEDLGDERLAVEAHLWTPSMLDEVHARLGLGREHLRPAPPLELD